MTLADDWAKDDAKRQIVLEERDRYKLERDELLAALLDDYDTRAHLREAILAGEPDAKQIPSARQAGPSQSG